MPEARDPKLERLIKLLKLTTSTNDAEALLASRKANEALVPLGGDWEALLHGKVTVIADPFDNLDMPPENGRRAPPPHPGSRPAPAPQNWTPYQKQRPPRPSTTTPQPPPSPSGKTLRNRFGGICSKCPNFVDVGKGFAVKAPNSKNWSLECVSCHNSSIA